MVGGGWSTRMTGVWGGSGDDVPYSVVRIERV